MASFSIVFSLFAAIVLNITESFAILRSLT